MRRLRTAAVTAALALTGGACGDGAEAPQADDLRVGVVIKGLDNPHFEAMAQGVAAAAREHGVEVRVRSAAGIEDTAGQAAQLEALVAEELDCYVVNPITQSNLVPALSHVPDGTPIVNVDSPVGADQARALGIEIVTYIGTDNEAAGRLAADAMAGLVGRDADVGVIGGLPGDASSSARIAGFTAAARGRFDPLEPVDADWDARKATAAAAALLRAEPAIEGFFAANDQMALGVARAVADAGRVGEVAVAGVDGIVQALAAVERGALAATVSQYPYTIGRLGVEACLAAASGAALPPVVDAPVQVVTPRNVAQAEANHPRPVEPLESPFAADLPG